MGTLSSVLMDPYNMKIITALYNQPRSVRELAYAFNIPLTTCYRKIKELEEIDLIVAEGKYLAKNGRRYTAYRSNLIKLSLNYEKGILEVRFQLEWSDPVCIRYIQAESGDLVRSETDTEGEMFDSQD